MKQRVMQFTTEGVAFALRFLDDARQGRAMELHPELLDDPRYTRETSIECFVEKREFTNRREAGRYLSGTLEPLGNGNINGNFRLWSWLGMYYFDCMVGKDQDGKFELGSTPHHAFVFGRQKHENSRQCFSSLITCMGDLSTAW